MPTLDFYQFIGVIAPGSVLLVSLSLLFDIKQLQPLLAPDSLGGLGVHFVLAYIAGQLLQGLGNLIEFFYWKLWGGLPAMWPVTRPKRKSFPKAVDIICQAAHVKSLTANSEDRLREWQRLIAQVRSTVYAKDRAKRLEIFNGNYGLFRGLLACTVVIALVAWKSPYASWTLYGAMGIGILLVVWRMHRFSVHYATELFANAAELTAQKDDKQ